MVHSRARLFHSLNRADNKITTKIEKSLILALLELNILLENKGNIIISSTSKITNTTAIKKKCTLKVKRDSPKELNPHSNVLWSSRSDKLFFLNIEPTIIKALVSKKEKIIIFISNKIQIVIHLTWRHLKNHNFQFFLN